LFPLLEVRRRSTAAAGNGRVALRAGFDAKHVREIDLQRASDEAIWSHASTDNAIIITKDDDFVKFAHLRGQAHLVWVRIGNCSNSMLLEWFKAHWPKLLDRLRLGDALVELR